MANYFQVICLLSLSLVQSVAFSGRHEWWPPHGQFKVKCPYKKVDLSWYNGTANPCPHVYQPICGTDVKTYDNPCILCIESLKSKGRIRFSRNGFC